MRSHVPHSLAVILTLTANLVPSVEAAPFALDVNICNTDVPAELPSKKFPIGCEILDCCPACRGPGPLEVRLDFAAPAGSETRLTVEGVPEAAVRALKLGGNIKWAHDGTLVLGPGESSIRGWPSDAKQVPVFTPQVRFADAAIKHLAKANSKGADQSAGTVATLSVTQFLGRFPVREYAVRYTIHVCPQRSSDSIQLFNNTANDRTIVLLDARRSTGCVNDEVWRGSGTIDVGSVLSNDNCRSEIAVFSEDNALALSTDVTAWADQLQDVLETELQPLVRESVTYWVLQGGFTATRVRVKADALRANQLFNQMKGGIGFNTTAINDATADPDTNDLLAANCDKATALRSKIGFIAGHLNVYYNQVVGARGWSCDDDIIIVGTTADNETLAHEFGHAFTLDDTAFVTTNLMASGGTDRDTITLGQLFRASVNNASRVNVHGLRPGGLTRNCPDTKTSDECPKLDLDIIR